MDASQSLGRRQNAAHLDSTTIVEASRSLSLRGTSGERAGERGTFHRMGAANWNPLSLTLSPLLCRGERESTSGRVLVLRCAPSTMRVTNRIVGLFPAAVANLFMIDGCKLYRLPKIISAC